MRKKRFQCSWILIFSNHSCACFGKKTGSKKRNKKHNTKIQSHYLLHAVSSVYSPHTSSHYRGDYSHLWPLGAAWLSILGCIASLCLPSSAHGPWRVIQPLTRKSCDCSCPWCRELFVKNRAGRGQGRQASIVWSTQMSMPLRNRVGLSTPYSSFFLFFYKRLP